MGKKPYNFRMMTEIV